jgi:hypothetical protein
MYHGDIKSKSKDDGKVKKMKKQRRSKKGISIKRNLPFYCSIGI